MMRASVKSADLAGALKHSIAARSGTLPVLQHALLEAANDSLRITTSDLETTVAVTIPADIEHEGSLCALNTLLRSSPALGGNLALSERDSKLHIKSGGRNSVRVPMLAAAEFPIPDNERWMPLAVDPVGLRTAINAVVYAGARNDVRRYLEAVHLRDGFAEASDGHRCAIAPLNYQGPKLLIPLARAPAIAALLDETSTVEIVGTRLLRVRTGGVEMSVLLLNLTFVDLESLIPWNDSETGFLVSRQALARAVGALSSFARIRADGTEMKWPALRLSVSPDGCDLAALEGSTVGLDDCTDVRGTSVFGVNPDYLQAAVESATGGDLLKVNIYDRSILVHAVDGDDRHLMMGVTT